MEFRVWGEHAVAGTEGAEVVDELKPEADDFVIAKKRYSAFPGTQLDLLLRELRIEELVVIGIQTNCCVQHTVWDGFVRAYDTVVLEDACDAPSQDDHDAGINYMRTFYRTRVATVDDWINSKEGSGPAK